MVETGRVVVAFLQFGLVKLAVGNDLGFHFNIETGDVFFEAFAPGNQAYGNKNEKRLKRVNQITHR